MKIAIIWETFLFYHIARLSASFRFADQLGHRLLPIAIRSGTPELSLQRYHSILSTRCIQLSNDPINHHMQSRESAHQLLFVLNRESPDAVAIPGYDSRVALAALGWCRKNRRGAVLMSDSQQRDFKRYFWKELIKRYLVGKYDAAFVAGKSSEAYMRFLRMPQECIYSGCDVVDNSFWTGWAQRVQSNPVNWRSILNLPEKFFLTVSRLIPEKNVEGLLRAYAIYMKKSLDPWHLVIAGDGPLRKSLEMLAGNLGVFSKVHFLGYISSEQAGPVYGLASAFILASAISETWGLVINEAMAAGLPVLVSDICGCVPDLVINGETGFSFDPHNEENLASLLLRLCDDQEISSKMGETAQKIIQNYSLDKFAQNLFSAANQAVKHANRR